MPNKADFYTSKDVNGFTFKVFTPFSESAYDEMDMLGKYTDRPTDPDAIDRKYRGDMDRHSYRYFEPMNSLADNRKDFYESGYTKHQAHEIAKHYTLEAYRYAEGLNKGDYSIVDVIVQVFYKGHELAEIGSSTDSDSVDEYLIDLYVEAMGEAVTSLEDLDSKPKTLAKAKDALMILKAEARAEYNKSRRASFLKRISAWRDMSLQYQNNRTVTRHMWKHIQTKKIAYYRVR